MDKYKTSLCGNKSIAKNDVRIKFRGQIDKLMALTILTENDAITQRKTETARALKFIDEILKDVMRVEVLGTDFKDYVLFNKTLENYHIMSHETKKYFDIDFLQIDGSADRLVLQLNYLRCAIRECELLSIDVIDAHENDFKEGIAVILNRLSSLLYIMEISLFSGISLEKVKYNG